MSEPTQQKLATSDAHQGKINEVRDLLGDLPTEMASFLSNATIQRFLRARNWSTSQAVKTLKEAAKWRRQYQPEKISWEDIVDVENEAKRAYIPDYLDKKGRMVFVTLPATKSKVSEKEQIKYLVYILENLVLDTEDAQDENVVWISDFRGMIAVAIITNAPRIFESFWKIIKHFLEPKMKEKVKFVHNNNLESMRIMAEMFDMDKLESTFGGKNTAGVDIVKYAERLKTRGDVALDSEAPVVTSSISPVMTSSISRVCIDEVWELLGDLRTEMPSFLTDGTIRRFLRARNWSTEQATKALKETAKWRRQYKPDQICWDDLADRENEARRAYLPDYLDKNGRSVFVTMTSIKILKHLIEPALNEKVKFIYTKNSESQRIMADMFDMDKLESAFGGRNTSDLDMVKYAERMRRQDQIRGSRMNANVNTSSS
ncbi:hypothetical protein EJB05_34662 [Eragrostis curvula]|uniref:CRAL-TRIO domain-containing protein n=1 Tax=Eragrostis curvula TaxID=38414 RepID=A0A5J9U4N4_9POAL|nr:hypothetical protein EJB05_34662 [Eragrostis curvula]